jgi:hypothetical protein
MNMIKWKFPYLLMMSLKNNNYSNKSIRKNNKKNKINKNKIIISYKNNKVFFLLINNQHRKISNPKKLKILIQDNLRQNLNFLLDLKQLM